MLYNRYGDAGLRSIAILLVLALNFGPPFQFCSTMRV